MIFERNLILSTLTKSAWEVSTFLSNFSCSCREAARKLCDHFGFYDAKGTAQISTCAKAIKYHISVGNIAPSSLNVRSGENMARKPRLLQALPSLENVPSNVSSLCDLTAVPVETSEQMALWNTIMKTVKKGEARSMVGRQQRYLFQSSGLYLGAGAVCDPAHDQKLRDTWIGWDPELRRQKLDSGACLSRFAILSWAENCEGLAFACLNMMVSRFPSDFEKRYGTKPLFVETYVEKDNFNFKDLLHQAGWRCLGKNSNKEHPREVFVLEFDPKFRAELGLKVSAGLGPLSFEEAASSKWADLMVQPGSLGNTRNEQRMKNIIETQQAAPDSSFSDAACGDKAAIKAQRRFLENSSQKINEDNMLVGSFNTAARVCENFGEVLAVADGCILNFTGKKSCTDLGHIGTNQTPTVSYGLEEHGVLACSLQGEIGGVLHSNIFAHEVSCDKDAPAEEKESFVWDEDLLTAIELKKRLGSKKVTLVGDRGADILRIFWLAYLYQLVYVLVRCHHNRACFSMNEKGEYVKEKENLFDSLKHSKKQGEFTTTITTMDHGTRRQKDVTFEVRFGQYTLRYDDELTHKQQYVTVNVVYARQKNYYRSDRLEWFLMTNDQVNNLEDAIMCVKKYATRWTIEVWHKILKSDACYVEDIPNLKINAIKRAIVIKMIVAARILFLTRLSRTIPFIPLANILTNIERMVVETMSNFNKSLYPPTMLGEFIEKIAIYGGYEKRKGRNPGPKVIRRVLEKFFENVKFLTVNFRTTHQVSV
ncbi:MAG: IS4 family transposase [Desulfovibrionaceae bacterium]|nr:IS4 family transposase [Desulfovibrionaceae bacterium]